MRDRRHGWAHKLGRTGPRIRKRLHRKKRSDGILEEGLRYSQGNSIADPVVHPIYVFDPRTATLNIFPAQIDQNRLEMCLLLSVSWLPAGRTHTRCGLSVVDIPPSWQLPCRMGLVKDDRQPNSRVIAAGDALAAVETGEVAGTKRVDQAVHGIAAARDDVCESPFVDLPVIIGQDGAPDKLALRASSSHLLQPEVATIGEVELPLRLGGTSVRIRHGVDGRRVVNCKVSVQVILETQGKANVSWKDWRNQSIKQR